ncbi:GspE/PulE family protein [Patescibacteria group bacterium]
MTTNDDDNTIKGIDDLISESKDQDTGTDAKEKPVLAEEKVTERFEEKMKEIRIKELEAVTEKQANSSSVPYINLIGFPVSGESLNSILRDIAKEEKVVCFYKTDKEVKLGTPNPDNPNLQGILDTLKEETVDGKGEIYLISQHSYDETIKLYEKFPQAREFSGGIKITEEELLKIQEQISNFGLLNAKLNKEKNITTIFKMILAGAMKSNASDIHIEAEEKKVTLRYRVDGMLHIAASMPKKMWHKLDSRIKSISGLKINVTSKPQDGRITVFLKGGEDKLEIRVSTLPTSYGESIVMRLLKSTVASLGFEDLGVRGKAKEDLDRQVARPIGMIITTGPTGSGKTTSLYAILNKLNDPDTKIITLEDPIEFKLEGISQSQIDHSQGYSFADGLRSILRQDPDIIMVGELRDLETAEVAVQAALTGHKVVSTLHTNDAAGAIPRFISMGVKPFLLAPALNAVIGQRLCRRIHDKCKEEMKIEAKDLAKVKEVLGNLPENSGYKIDMDNLKFYKGKGCDECNHIGLKGRIGIYEIFPVEAEIEKKILAGNTSEYEIAQIAHDLGMITMVQDGLLKALDGMTTVEEIFRVTE